MANADRMATRIIVLFHCLSLSGIVVLQERRNFRMNHCYTVHFFRVFVMGMVQMKLLMRERHLSDGERI